MVPIKPHTSHAVPLVESFCPFSDFFNDPSPPNSPPENCVNHLRSLIFAQVHHKQFVPERFTLNLHIVFHRLLCTGGAVYVSSLMAVMSESRFHHATLSVGAVSPLRRSQQAIPVQMSSWSGWAEQ